MKLNFVIEKDSVGLQTLDWFYAHRQFINSHKNYKSDFEIVFNEQFEKCDKNILYTNMCEQIQHNIHDFDLVLIDNAGESLEVSTPFMKDTVEKYPHVFLLCGAFVPTEHPLHYKIIPYNHCLQRFRKSYTEGFYPNFYESPTNLSLRERKHNFYFIGGANRSWRWYFSEQLKSKCNFVDQRPNQRRLIKTLDCQFETDHDTAFRNFVNRDIEYHPDEEVDLHYYSDTVYAGINRKFGEIAQGLFLLPQYREYRCVIFPESGWINNQFFMTEKVFKCFVAECLPMPISGSNTCKFYREHGFYTLLDLCPASLQQVDQIENHVERYQAMIEVIQWVNDHISVLYSEEAQHMVKSNKNNLFDCKLNYTTTTALSNLFQRYQ